MKIQDIIEIAEKGLEVRPGLPQSVAPNGQPYLAFSGDIDFFYVEVNKYKLAAGGDAIWWRVRPEVDHAGSSAYCRLLVGNKADEQPEFVPAPVPEGMAGGADDSISIACPHGFTECHDHIEPCAEFPLGRCHDPR